MPTILIGTLIDFKPVTITTDRSITIVCRIDARMPFNVPVNSSSGSVPTIAEVVVVVPTASDIRVGDRFAYGGLFYTVSGKLPEANLGNVEQYLAVARE